jgi:hypothetical protein
MLIDNLDTLKSIIPTIAGRDFTRYSTYLEAADRYLAREITGSALYEKLSEADNKTLLSYCQKVSAFKAYLDAIPSLDLIETETGFGIVSNGNIAPASRERVLALAKQTELALSDAIEDLIRFLEENTTYHESWKASKAYSLIADSYILSMDEFRRYANFTGSRLDFVKLKPVILRIQKLKIEPVISPELSSEVITQLKTNNLSEANKKIIENLRFALALFTTNDREYKELIITRDNNPSIQSGQLPPPKHHGKSFLMEVRKTIINNADNYPAFKGSTLYTEIQENNKRDNPEKLTQEPFLICGA